jgi:hypothetical protein
MLNDIFAYRYKDTPVWQSFGEPERQLLVQAFQIVNELLDPKEYIECKTSWTPIHDKLCRELGLKELSPKTWGYWTQFQGQDYPSTGEYSMGKVCETFILAVYDGSIPADRFMKERLSFIELVFREREEEIKQINAELPQRILEARKYDAVRTGRVGGPVFPGSKADALKAQNLILNKVFKEAVGELNERLRRSGCGLDYHNGFIQQSSDELTKQQVGEPFWELVSSEDWKNVDYDMKNAIDKRDNGEPDAAFYAARALESAIKIISDNKHWTHGKENGASAYIDNLCNQKRGGNLIHEWEKEALKHFFTKVRNPMSHGPGIGEMPELSPSQTDWAIEYCMSWIKSLIRRG